MDNPVIYRAAPELGSLARQLIKEYHPHLSDASIGYMFRSGRWLERGATRLGQALIAPPVWRSITGYDLVLVVNEEAFKAQTADRQMAMLDNLLCYFDQPVTGQDGCKYKRRAPDIVEFSDVVRRRKTCFSNLNAVDGSYQKIQFDDALAQTEPEDIGCEFETADDEAEPITVEDYDDIDDTGCTVTNLMSFDN